MRHTLVVLALCAVLLGGTLAPTMAAPSFFGYTGLVRIPTADALSMGEFNAAGFFIQGDSDATVFAGNLGVLPGLEVGAAFIDPENGDNDVLLNAKYRFRAEGTVMPAIAVGIADAADELDSTPYLVLSKSLAPANELFNPQIHLGVGDGLLDGFFVGGSVDVAKNISLMAEHDGEDLNVGARLAISDELRIHAAGFDGFDDFGAGISYNKKF